MSKEIKINNVVKLKDGRIGKVYGQIISTGEWILESGRGGQISYFNECDVEEVKK